MNQKKRLSLFRNAAASEPLESRLLFSTAITFGSNTNFVAGTAPVALAAADFNGDGDIDLAVADKATDKVNIFFGNGAGAFSAGPVLSLSSPPTAIITGDFNGDGRADIAVATTAAAGQSTTAVDVFLNTGAGTFGLGQITTGAETFGLGQITTVETGATPGEPVALVAGDFNNNGKLDLAVTGYSSQSINILTGNNNGTFAAPITYSADQYPTGISEGDFNDDGYPDLAVTSTSVNVLGGQTNDGTATNQVSLLLDSSTGDFSAGPNISISLATGTVSGVVTANLTTAATPGLLVTNTAGSVTLVTNTGGTFAAAAQPDVNGGATGVAVGDFNLDGETDFVAGGGSTSIINNSSSVTVVPGLGNGTVDASVQLSTGSNPVAVVVADFNNDGKPDIATANENDGTVSILLNTTTIPLVGTTISVASSDLSAPAGTAVTFTATVKGGGASPLPGESLPTGTVNFYDGASLLGSVSIVGGTNQATLTTSGLTVGSHRIGVTYAGDPAYADSASVRIVQVIQPTATEGPDLVGTLVSSTFPSTVAPGETGTVKIQITNQGNTPADGLIINDLYLSLDDTVDGGDTALVVRGGLARANLHLQPGKSVTLVGTVIIPQSAALATYELLTQLDATGSLAESVSSNDTVVSPSTYTVADVFGTLGGHAGVVLNVTDNNGTAATFKLTGPGNGAVNIGDGGVEIVLTGTTAASTLSVIGSAGFVATDLRDNSPIGTIRGGLLSVTNTVTLAGGAASITLNSAGSGVAGNAITIGAGSATAIKIASVPGVDLAAAGGLKSLMVGTWASGNISAGWIGTLRSTQQLQGNITLSGSAAPGGVALGSATVGSVASGVWSITGSAGRVAIGATPAGASGWSLNASGALRSLTLGGTFYGNVSAGSIGTMSIAGDLNGGQITSSAGLNSLTVRGNLVNADVLSATTLGTLRITGGATNSVVGAGVTSSTPPVTVDPDGKIRSISVLGSADQQSRFIAATLPRRAVLGGVSILTAGDPRFET